jgi:ribonucleoside-diphosphate reductase alpha chain
MRRIISSGRVRPVEEMPESVRRLFVTSLEVPPLQHVEVQAAFQRHTNNAVSKTLNLPADSTPEDVREVYWKAYEFGCKGITVYRDTSRKSQVLAVECCSRRDVDAE